MTGFTEESAARVARATKTVERMRRNGKPPRARFVGGGGRWECGKLDAEMSYDGTVTVSIWRWNGSAMADTTENVTARDWLLSSGQTIASGKRVIVMKHRSNQWFVVGAQCS
jgi:hypothetical protein